MTQADLFSLIEEAPGAGKVAPGGRVPQPGSRAPDQGASSWARHPASRTQECIRPTHHPIKLQGDPDWWCSFCGERGLPAPPPRKEWE
jgi:hypothetical protein